MKKIAAIRIALSVFLSCLLIAAAPHAHSVQAARSKLPLTISFETGRYEPDPGCKRDLDDCLPKVFVPAREFKAGSKVWVKVTAVNHSRLTACSGENNFLIDVTESATGAKPGLVQHGDGMIFITATPPEFNYCIAPKQTRSNLILEVTHTYMITSPGNYTASVYVPGVGLTKAENLKHDDPYHVDFFRDAKAVKYTGKIESEAGQFVVVQ
jgi:hypothetical protein